MNLPQLNLLQCPQLMVVCGCRIVGSGTVLRRGRGGATCRRSGRTHAKRQKIPFTEDSEAALVNRAPRKVRGDSRAQDCCTYGGGGGGAAGAVGPGILVSDPFLTLQPYEQGIMITNLVESIIDSFRYPPLGHQSTRRDVLPRLHHISLNVRP